MSGLVQVLKSTSLSVTETFEIDGAPINVDSGLPTLVITRPDGSAYTPLPTVLDTWTGPPARTTGQYRFVLPRQTECIWLDYELTGTIGGQPQTLEGRVEWVGALLFTLAELRDYAMPGSATKPFTDTAKYPDKKLHQVRAAVLSRFSKALGVSPVPRFERETHSLGYGDTIIVRQLAPRKLLSVTVAGAAQPASGYFLSPGGIVRPVSNYQSSAWGSYGYGVVAIEYEHGLDGVDDDGSDAALQFAAAKLNPSAFTTGTTYTSPDGMSVTYEPSETGRGGFQRFTGIRDVDRWLNLHTGPSIPVA
jgi:hypothetical protein